MCRHKHAPHQSDSSPGVNNNISPTHNPAHSPYVPFPPTHLHASHCPKNAFKDDAHAHHEEKSSNGPEVCPAAHAPHSKIVEDSRDEEGTDDPRGLSTEEEGEGFVAEGDEAPSEDLMPAP